MVTSPPATFIKLDQKIEPLFSKHTPAIEGVLSEAGGAPAVVSLGHCWGQSAGRKTDADATNESIQAISGYSVENFGEVQHFVARICPHCGVAASGGNYGQFNVSRQASGPAGSAGLRSARALSLLIPSEAVRLSRAAGGDGLECFHARHRPVERQRPEIGPAFQCDVQ